MHSTLDRELATLYRAALAETATPPVAAAATPRPYRAATVYVVAFTIAAALAVAGPMFAYLVALVTVGR